jgi:DNA-binding GntR family transcriptional regulator
MTEPSGVLEFRRAGAADQISEVLRNRILGGELRPGDPLTEATLAREFDVSRNTVREGLRLLTREGLAVHEVHHGVSVRQFTVDEVRNLYAIVGIIEREVAHCAGHLGTDDADQLRGKVRRGAERRLAGDARGSMNDNVEFHLSLVALLGNPRLNEIFTELNREIHLALSALDRPPIEHLDERNLVLLGHLEKGDGDAFRTAVTEYVEELCAGVIRLIG